MIKAHELKKYSMIDFKIERFFKKLDGKVKRKAANGGQRLVVVIYDKFTSDSILFPEHKRKSFHSDLFADYVICDSEVFETNNRSKYIYEIQQKLLHHYGYLTVSWETFDDVRVCNAMQLSFCW